MQSFRHAAVFLILLFSGVSQSIAKGDRKPSVELIERCEKGDSDYACMLLGEEYRGLEMGREALVAHLKACKGGVAFSCTQAGFFTRELDKNVAGSLELSKKGCDLLDGLGCYNHACYLCLGEKGKSNPDAALSFIERAFSLGFHGDESIKKDPDLKCLLNGDYQKKLDQLISQSKQRGKLVAVRDYQMYVPLWGASIPMEGLDGFGFNASVGALVGPQGSLFIGSSSPGSISKNLEVLLQSVGKALAPRFPEIEEISKVSDEKVNGYRSVLLKAKHKADPKAISSVTLRSIYRLFGNEDFTSQVQFFYRSNMDDEWVSGVEKVILETVFDPNHQRKVLESFDTSQLSAKYAFRGSLMGSLFFSKMAYPTTPVESESYTGLSLSLLQDSISNRLDELERVSFIRKVLEPGLKMAGISATPKITKASSARTKVYLEDVYQIEFGESQKKFVLARFDLVRKVTLIGQIVSGAKTDKNEIPRLEDLKVLINSVVPKTELMRQFPERTKPEKQDPLPRRHGNSA